MQPGSCDHVWPINSHEVPGVLWSPFRPVFAPRRIGAPPIIFDVGNISYLKTGVDFNIIPCYGCFRIFRKSKYAKQYHRPSYRDTTSVPNESEIQSRRCGGCRLHAPDALVHGTKWLTTLPYDHNIGKRQLRCHKWLKLDITDEFDNGSGRGLCLRQIESGLCTKCWRDENSEWLAHKAQAEQVKQQLMKYTKWMQSIAQGYGDATHPRLPQAFNPWHWRSIEDLEGGIRRTMPVWTPEDFNTGPLCVA